MTVGSQTALTFLMEAAPELPDPEYLQNHKQARLKAATNDLWFLQLITTDLSVVSARNVSATRWEKEEEKY